MLSPAMAIHTEISRGRRLAASASLFAASVGWVWAFHRGGAVLTAFAGAIALAGVGIGRKSVLAQVLSRGVAWLVFVAGVFATLADHHLPLAALGTAAGAALLLSRPLLHTESARAEFAPMRFRRSFLAAATGTVTFAALAGGGALEYLRAGQLTAGVAWAAITASLLGAAIGVVRMRAWGVLLGAVTSIVMVAAAALVPAWREPLVWLAAPGALLALPVLLARLGAGGSDPPAVRVATSTPPALRIAGDPAGLVEEAEAEADASPARAEIGWVATARR
jgi:hypothetical protein